MGKIVYFGIAVLVAILAVTAFLLVSRKQPFETDVQNRQPVNKKTVLNKPQDRPPNLQFHHQGHQEIQGENEMKSEKENQNDSHSLGSRMEKNKKQPETPKGHLKFLGDHGSPIKVGEIEEIDFVLNGRDFYQHFARQRKPIVMRGAIKHWPAVKHWANESYLRQNYGDTIFDVQFTKKYETILPIKKTMTLNEYLDIYKKENVYLDCPFPQSTMTQDIVVPYCLQCDEFAKSIPSTHLLFSSGNTSSSLHFDGYENLLSVIAGTKEVLVANYSFSEYFYPENFTTVNIEAPIDPEAVDLIKFPKLAQVPFHKVTLNAGDILYIPEGWWHHVRSFNSPNIAISLWFGIFKEIVDSNSEQEVDSVSAIKRLEMFGEAVKNAPETIECQSQNRPISEVYWPKDGPDIPKLEDPDQWMVTLNSGYKMPRKGFGIAYLNDTKGAVLTALKAGFRLIDSAEAFMYNETAAGSAIKESGIPREELFIVSKVEPKNMGYDDTIKSVKRSLEKLQTPYLDLMLIHSPECDPEEGGLICSEGEPRGTWKDCWRALESVVNDGLVRSIGVSNFEMEHLKELKQLAKIQPAVLQNFFTPFYQDKEVRKYCKENSIEYMGFSILGTQYTYEDGFDINPVLYDEGIKAIAQAFDASPAQVVLKWALENNVVVLTRTKTPNRIYTNFNLHHIYLRDSDHKYFHSLDGKFHVDNEAEGEQENNDQQDQQVTRKPPVRNKDIIEKLVIEKKVNPDDPTLYVSSDDQWIYALDAKTGNLMWKYGTAEDGGSTCVFSPDESAVYCGTDDKSIRAFNRLDGTLLWKFNTDGAVTSSTRVGADGTLYVGCLDGFLYSIKPDGSLKWKTHLGQQIWSSPALKDGGRVVFVGSMADSPANVFALNGETGEIMWKYKTGGPVFSSPALSLDEKVMHICSFDGSCYAFDSTNGNVLWSFGGDAAFQSSPVMSHSHNLVFAASSEGAVYALNAENGTQVWKYQSKGEFFSSPFPSRNGNVYIGSGTGEVLAISQSEGKLVWSFKTETTDMVYSSPRMTNDGVLYIGGIDGYLYALRAENGEVVWKFKTNGPLVGTVRIPKVFNEPQS